MISAVDSINGQQWTTMDNNGQQWITMDNNGKQWTTMDNNGQQWTTMDRNFVNFFWSIFLNFVESVTVLGQIQSPTVLFSLRKCALSLV